MFCFLEKRATGCETLDEGHLKNVRKEGSVCFLNYKLQQKLSVMGMTAVRLFPGNHLEKNTQEFYSEKEEAICLAEQTSLVDQFITISSQARQSSYSRLVPSFQCRSSPYAKRIPKVTGETFQTWAKILTGSKLTPILFEFLSGEDLTVLKKCSRELSRVATIRLLENDNNWTLTMNILTPLVLRQTILRESRLEDEYQHSEDLDRTSGYFQSENQERLNQQKVKLDRIITTVSFQIRYFQGIMPICAALLQCFNEVVSYWLLRYLLIKCRHIQNDLHFYNNYLELLEQEFQNLLPEVYHHLQLQGLELNYFVMKWIMGLFSEDMAKPLLLSVWDLLCHSDIYVLIYVIVALFRIWQEEILRRDADGINELLKLELKGRLASLKGQDLIANSKNLYITRRLGS